MCCARSPTAAAVAHFYCRRVLLERRAPKWNAFLTPLQRSYGANTHSVTIRHTAMTASTTPYGSARKRATWCAREKDTSRAHRRIRLAANYANDANGFGVIRAICG